MEGSDEVRSWDEPFFLFLSRYTSNVALYIPKVHSLSLSLSISIFFLLLSGRYVPLLLRNSPLYVYLLSTLYLPLFSFYLIRSLHTKTHTNAFKIRVCMCASLQVYIFTVYHIACCVVVPFAWPCLPACLPAHQANFSLLTPSFPPLLYTQLSSFLYILYPFILPAVSCLLLLLLLFFPSESEEKKKGNTKAKTMEILNFFF